MRISPSRRREFITILVGAATYAWPLAARSQQPAMPVVGLLYGQSALGADRMRGFLSGLKENGYVGGDNVAIEQRGAEGHLDRLPALTAELVRRKVALIAALGNPAALAAKATTEAVPSVFLVNEDPVRLGLVTSLARPGGNATGVNFFSGELVTKRLELLHEPIPGAVRIAVLVNPANTQTAERTLKEIEAAARTIGLQIRILNATTSREIDAEFGTLAKERPDALFVGSDELFTSRRVQLANLASRHAIPATFHTREIAEAGGLISYGSDIGQANDRASNALTFQGSFSLKRPRMARSGVFQPARGLPPPELLLLPSQRLECEAT